MFEISLIIAFIFAIGFPISIAFFLNYIVYGRKKNKGFSYYSPTKSNIINEKTSYNKHLTSSSWDIIRKEAYKRANFTCERCGKKNTRLEAHHLNYNNLGNEQPEDLLVVCRKCHLELELEKENNKN